MISRLFYSSMRFFRQKMNKNPAKSSKYQRGLNGVVYWRRSYETTEHASTEEPLRGALCGALERPRCRLRPHQRSASKENHAHIPYPTSGTHVCSSQGYVLCLSTIRLTKK